MKVVLMKDIKGIGKAYTAVEVADGYALNCLIPTKVAILATPTVLKEATVRQKVLSDRKALEVKLVEERLSALAEDRVVFKKKANEKGHLYDGVDAREIAEVVSIPEHTIRIERSFKELGTFEVPVSFGEHFGKFSIVIEQE